MWYRPHDETLSQYDDEPLSAIVAGIRGDGRINLSVIDANGRHHERAAVPFVPEGDPRPVVSFAEWTPAERSRIASSRAVMKTSKETREMVLNHLNPGTYTTAEEFVRALDVVARYVESGELPVKTSNPEKPCKQ